MNKKPTDIDPKTAFAEVFKRLAGIKGMTAWARTHRTLFYGLFAKLISQPLVQTNVNVNIDRGEEARMKLQDAFRRLIDARDKDTGVVTVDGLVIDGETQPPVPRLPTPDANESLVGVVDPRPATVGARPPPPDPAPPAALTPEQARERAMAPSYPQPVSGEPSTTQKYLDWAATRRDPGRIMDDSRHDDEL